MRELVGKIITLRLNREIEENKKTIKVGFLFKSQFPLHSNQADVPLKDRLKEKIPRESVKEKHPRKKFSYTIEWTPK
jgi:hypothetical protein